MILKKNPGSKILNDVAQYFIELLLIQELVTFSMSLLSIAIGVNAMNGMQEKVWCPLKQLWISNPLAIGHDSDLVHKKNE